MQEFLQIALSFPTVVFSSLIVVLLCYWLMVILGALDLDLLDFDFDFDLDGNIDFEMDADLDVDADGASAGLGFLASMAGALGLGTVPVTVIASFWIMAAWMLSFASVFYLTPILGAWSGLIAALFGFGSFIAAVPVTMLAMQPLIQVFSTVEAERGGDSLIGTVCTVTTSKVTESFGQAEAADGGAGLVLSVRCHDGNTLERGTKALVIDYDREEHAYIIDSYDSLLGNDSTDDVVFAEAGSEQASSKQEEARVAADVTEQA